MTDMPKSHAINLARAAAHKEKYDKALKQIKIDAAQRKEQERKDDRRRMILLGRLLTKTLANGDTIKNEKDMYAKLNVYLVEDRNRILFAPGLAAAQQPSTTPTPGHTAHQPPHKKTPMTPPPPPPDHPLLKS